MGAPQRDRFVRLSTELLEALLCSKLTGVQFRIILWVIRNHVRRRSLSRDRNGGFGPATICGPKRRDATGFAVAPESGTCDPAQALRRRPERRIDGPGAHEAGKKDLAEGSGERGWPGTL